MKYTLIFFLINAILNLGRFKKRGGGTTYIKIKADIIRFNYSSMQLLNGVHIERNIPIYLFIDESSLTIYPFITDEQAIKLEFPIVKETTETYHKLELDLFHTDPFLIWFFNDKRNVFYKLDNVKNKFVGPELSILANFEAKYLPEKTKIAHFNCAAKEVIITKRNERLEELTELISSNPNINDFHALVSILYLSNNHALFLKLDRIISNINSRSIQSVDDVDMSKSGLTLVLDNNDVISFTEFFKHGEVEFNNDFNVITDRFIDRILNVVKSEFEKISFKYSGLKKLFEKYMDTIRLSIDSPTPMQQAMLEFARSIIKLDIDFLFYNPKAFISCHDKEEFFKQMNEAFKTESKKEIKKPFTNVRESFHNYKSMLDENVSFILRNHVQKLSNMIRIHITGITKPEYSDHHNMLSKLNSLPLDSMIHIEGCFSLPLLNDLDFDYDGEKAFVNIPTGTGKSNNRAKSKAVSKPRANGEGGKQGEQNGNKSNSSEED
jgi:hypothetical protein